MTDLRHTYAEKAICQIPRLLSLQDRNPFSPTYGSFHRRYWLDKVDDFADGLTQFGVHSLALVYARHFPQNPYYEQPKIRDWIVAGIDYWAKIQHKDGTFDEFYPYERGWVGPTAFTTFAMVETVNLMKEKDALPPDVEERVRNAIRKGAHSIAQGESEEDSLANHHAMACLALWKAHRLLGDEQILRGYERIWQGFLQNYHRSEGWSLEYDGVDPGYLSATVSFLGKIYQEHPTDEMKKVLEQAVNFASYFVYPNGYYAGSMGSRQTLHFYPHGFEILAPEIPLAAAVAERMLRGLSEGALVPPEIMADRYFLYRAPEFLQAYLDYAPRSDHLPSLPYQREPFRTYFSGAKIFAARTQRHYLLVNLAKGGVVKFFDVERECLLYNDCGLLGRLENGTVVSSQWIDENYKVTEAGDELMIEGHMNKMPSTKLFTPFRTILFRGVLVVSGWSVWFSHFLKGAIRRMLMLGSHPAPVRFRRRIVLEQEDLKVEDDIHLEQGTRFDSLSVGGEFFVRYVPQSRYFQAQELDIPEFQLDEESLEHLNTQSHIRLARLIHSDTVTSTGHNTGDDVS